MNGTDALSEQFGVDGVALQGSAQLPTSAMPSALAVAARVRRSGFFVLLLDRDTDLDACYSRSRKRVPPSYP